MPRFNTDRDQARRRLRDKLGEIPDIGLTLGSILEQVSVREDGQSNVGQATFAGALKGGSALSSLGPLGILGGALFGGISGFGGANRSNADFYDSKAISDSFKLSSKTVSPSIFGDGGLINGEDIIPVQMELDETYVTPDLNIYDSKAKLKHSEMKDEDITDMVTDNSFALSNVKKFKPSNYKDEILGYGFAHYEENGKFDLEKVLFSDVFGDSKKEMTYAEGGKKLRKEFKTVRDGDKGADLFTRITNDENKQARLPFINRLIELHEDEDKDVEPFIPQKFEQGGSMNRQDPKLKKSESNFYKDLLNAYANEKGIDPKKLDEQLEKIAFHESDGTMDPSINQNGGGPGRGIFQFEKGENQAANTAINRLIRASEENYGIKVPDDFYELYDNDYDVTILNRDFQKALFLGNDRKHPTSDISKVVKGNTDLADYWGKFHQTENDPDKIEKFKQDSLRFENTDVPEFKKGGKMIKKYELGGPIFDDLPFGYTKDENGNIVPVGNTNESVYDDLFLQLDNLEKYNEENFNTTNRDTDSLFRRMNTRNGLSSILRGTAVGLQSTRVDPKLRSTRFLNEMFEEFSPATADQLTGDGFARANSLVANVARDNPRAAGNIAPKLFDSALAQANNTRFNINSQNLQQRRAKYKFLNSTDNFNRAERIRADESTRNLINKKRSQLAGVGVDFLQNRERNDINKFNLDKGALRQRNNNKAKLFQNRVNVTANESKFSALNAFNDERLNQFNEYLESQNTINSSRNIENLPTIPSMKFTPSLFSPNFGELVDPATGLPLIDASLFDNSIFS